MLKGICKKISCLWLVSRFPQFGCVFGKSFVELIYKSFSGNNSSLELPDFCIFRQFSIWSGRIKRVERFD